MSAELDQFILEAARGRRAVAATTTNGEIPAPEGDHLSLITDTITDVLLYATTQGFDEREVLTQIVCLFLWGPCVGEGYPYMHFVDRVVAAWDDDDDRIDSLERLMSAFNDILESWESEAGR